MDIKITPHTFKFRTGDTDEKGGCTFIGGSWVDKTTDELFKNKKIILFSLPGAFTPTCSGQQLPTYDKLYSDITKEHIDDVYCISVNDAFVMNAWARDLEIQNVKMIPDGCGTFTRNMGMLVNKPKPCAGLFTNIPKFLVNVPQPSGIILTFLICKSLAQAFITKASFTDIQYTSSIPILLNESYILS